MEFCKIDPWKSSMLKRHLRAWLLHLQATHSLAEKEVALPHGRSKWNGLHFSHSLPAVLCLHWQVISPVYISLLLRQSTNTIRRYLEGKAY
jgi:hypothetical protein